MSNTAVHSTNKVEQWRKKYHVEYVRENRFASEMGKTSNAPIQMYEDLTKKAGDELTITLIMRLQGAGVTGDNELEGNEEALANYGWKIAVDQLRNAVALGVMEDQKTEIDLLMAAEVPLKNWSSEKLRDEIIVGLYSPNVDGVTSYASTSEANKDIWLAANDDRILFGIALSNTSTTDHSASLLNIDSTNDVMTAAGVSLAKRMAKLADPHIRPVKLSNGVENYIIYANSLCFRDLESDSTVIANRQQGESRGRDNPLFQGGDIYIYGVIVKEIEDIGVISGVGAGAIDVAANFLVGAQAIGVAWAKKTHTIKDSRDYGNINGRGVAEIRGIGKMMYNTIQHGVFTWYCAAVADT